MRVLSLLGEAVEEEEVVVVTIVEEDWAGIPMWVTIVTSVLVGVVVVIVVVFDDVTAGRVARTGSSTVSRVAV